MALTPDQQAWTSANLIMRLHGDRAPVHIAERIGALALAGDAQGIAMWQSIAHRVDQLTKCQAVQ